MSERPPLPESLPKIPDPPSVALAVLDAEHEASNVRQLACMLETRSQAIIAINRLQRDKISWPEPALVKVVDELDRALRSENGHKVPIETVRNAMEMIAQAIPRIRRAQALKAEVLKNLAAAGVDMEERERLLAARRAPQLGPGDAETD